MGSGWFVLYKYANHPVLSIAEQDFTIREGDTLRSIAERLNNQGIIEHPKIFSLFARLSLMAHDLRAGDYLIKPGLSAHNLLLMFIEGRVRYYDITLVEGLNFNNFLKLLNQNPKLTKPITQKDREQFLHSLNIKGSPEGLFYPDTYFFESGTTVKSILIRAHKRLERVLAEEWADKAKGLPYKTPYQALVMASVIEKETGATFERPDIASVFIRRLQRGMRLQSDPTVIYGMGNRYKGDLKRFMLRERTPYNTYIIKGLPPTPIAMVGREAINAALHPASGKALYFVAKGDGTHYFSDSLAEHNKAVRKYQITNRRADYRSAIESN